MDKSWHRYQWGVHHREKPLPDWLAETPDDPEEDREFGLQRAAHFEARNRARRLAAGLPPEPPWETQPNGPLLRAPRWSPTLVHNGIGVRLYGSTAKQQLTGEDRAQAERFGYVPVAYQATKWFVMLYAPVVPLGTYRVLKLRQPFWTMEPPSYAMVRVPWDWKQVVIHYAVVYGWIWLALLLSLMGKILP